MRKLFYFPAFYLPYLMRADDCLLYLSNLPVIEHLTLGNKFIMIDPFYKM